MVDAARHPWDGPVPDDAGFREWMLVRASALRRKAFLLCGDWSAADDLVQDVLVAMYPRWSRIVRGGHVDAYANRVLIGKHVDKYEQMGMILTPALHHPGFVFFLATLGITCFGTTLEITLSLAYVLAQGLGWTWSENLRPARDSRPGPALPPGSGP